MFDQLSDKLSSAFKTLTGQSKLSEKNISDAMQMVREALLEADVSYIVVKHFIEKVTAECIGQEVHKAVSPSQQVIKIVSDQLTSLMGESNVPLNIGTVFPSVIMMVGLHGSGKTTTTAKLANYIRKNLNKRPLLVAGDIYRPAAIKQLQILGESLGIEVYAEPDSKDVSAIVQNALTLAKAKGNEVVIIDTAGRFQVDEVMVQELIRIRDVAKPSEILLVADAALGQEAVSVAEHFHKALQITGVVLSKLDGDARGGAALSIRDVTLCPIKFVGVGEKIEDLDIFYPDRMASRILGMGDMVSLVEKTIEQSDLAEMEKLHKKLKKAEFDFNDFLGQLRQIQKMGGFESILKMLPGGSKLLANTPIDTRQFKRVEAMILSMTPAERGDPNCLDFSRRKRIAKGAGMPIEQTAQIINQFNSMRKMMKSGGGLGGLLGGGTRPGPTGIPGGMPAMSPFGGGMPAARGSNFTPAKKKRKK